MVQVGDGVEVPLKGDASGVKKAAAEAVGAVDKLITKSDQLQAALNDVNITSKLTNTQLAALQKEAQGAATKVAALSQASSSTAQTAQSLGQAGLKANAAMMALGGAAGGATGEMGKLLTGSSNMAMAFATGGPLLAGLAAFGVVMSVINSKMEEQVAEAAALDAHYKSLTGTVVALRDKAAGGKASGDMDLMVAKAKTGDGASDAVTEKQIRLLAELEGINRQRLAVTEQVADLERTMANVYDPKIREEQENTLVALQGNAASIEIAAKATLEQFEIAPKLGAEMERLAKAAAAHAKAQADAATALKEQQALVRAIENSKWVASQMPNGGQLQPGAFAAGGGDDVAPAFSQLSTAGMKLDMDSFTPPAAAFEGMDHAMEGVTSGLIGMSAINLPAMTKSLHEARLGLKELEDAGRAASAELAGNVVSGVMGQGGFNTAGATTGAAIGGVVDAASGGATGGLGATIGTILGAALGGVLDNLVDILGVVTPLMDGLAVAIAALSPVFYVLKMLMADIGQVFVDLAPVIHEIAKPLAAIVLIFVRVIEAVLPFVSMLLLSCAALLQFLGYLTAGIKILDDYFFQPLVDAARKLYNGFVDAYNAIISTIRLIPGMEEFGTKASHMDASTELFDQYALSTEELADIMKENTDATADNTGATSDAADSFNRDLQNLPQGYKVAMAEYDAQDARDTGGTSFRDINLTVNGFDGNMGDLLDNVKRYAKRGSHTGRKGNSRTSIPDWRN